MDLLAINYNDNHIIAIKILLQLHDNDSSYSECGFTFIYQKLTNILQINLFLDQVLKFSV